MARVRVVRGGPVEICVVTLPDVALRELDRGVVARAKHTVVPLTLHALLVKEAAWLELKHADLGGFRRRRGRLGLARIV